MLFKSIYIKFSNSIISVHSSNLTYFLLVLHNLSSGGDTMTEIQDLLKDIEKLRKNLLDLIEKKQFDLQDPDIIAASQILNAAISKYNEFISKKL